MSRCTVATATNASSIAACTEAAEGPVAAISTKVPSHGCARRALLEAGRINRQDALDALGHVVRRQRGTRDVPDVTVDLEWIVERLADELGQPRVVGDL